MIRRGFGIRGGIDFPGVWPCSGWGVADKTKGCSWLRHIYDKLLMSVIVNDVLIVLWMVFLAVVCLRAFQFG